VSDDSDQLAKKLDELPERIAQAVARALLGRRRIVGPGRGAERELLEKREVARRLGCKVETVYNLIRSGQVEVVHAGAREKVRTRDVQRLVEQGWRKPGEAETPVPAKSRRARRSKVEDAVTAGSAAELERQIAQIKV
jgi:excisionase family DNA binding protein